MVIAQHSMCAQSPVRMWLGDNYIRGVIFVCISDSGLTLSWPEHGDLPCFRKVGMSRNQMQLIYIVKQADPTHLCKLSRFRVKGLGLIAKIIVLSLDQ